MSEIQYLINQKEYSIHVDEANVFLRGDDVNHSNYKNDPIFNQKWYEKGYTTTEFFSNTEFNLLKNDIERFLKNIIHQELNLNTDDFSLERYHQFVNTDEKHFKIINKTRDLFDDDFHFSTKEIINRLSSILNIQLSDVNPLTNQKIHIVLRINRPFSIDYNPPHKDIYEIIYEFSLTPPLINFWIPIAGVTERSALPLAPSSHLLNELDIQRTRMGAKMGKQTYRVRIIKSWGNKNELIRSKVKNKEVLIFSSYLIHGLAINEQPNTTRMALEFRLLRK